MKDIQVGDYGERMPSKLRATQRISAEHRVETRIKVEEVPLSYRILLWYHINAQSTLF